MHILWTFYFRHTKVFWIYKFYVIFIFLFCLCRRFCKYFVPILLLYKHNCSWEFYVFNEGFICPVFLEIGIMIFLVKRFWWHLRFENGWIDLLHLLLRRNNFNPFLNQNASFDVFVHSILQGSFNLAKLMQSLFSVFPLILEEFQITTQYTCVAKIVLFAQKKHYLSGVL